MFRSILASTATLLIASSAFGQSFFVPSDTPATGNCNLIPFGSSNTNTTWVNQKYQCMATAAQLGSKPIVEICDLAFAPCGSGVQEFKSIEIVLAQTNAATLSTDFNANLATNVQTVLAVKGYEWHLTKDSWNRIGLDHNYTYLASSGKNLVIQVTVTGNNFVGTGAGFHRTDAQQRVFAMNWTGTLPATGTTDQAALKFEINSKGADTHRFGRGCKGSNGVPALDFFGSAQLGETLGMSVSNCVANAPLLQVFGLTRHPSGIDLALLGAPGCTLYETTDIVIGGSADGTGVYNLKAVIPNDQNLVCLRAYTQAFPADNAANNFGRTASNYGRILIGQ